MALQVVEAVQLVAAEQWQVLTVEVSGASPLAVSQGSCSKCAAEEAEEGERAGQQQAAQHAGNCGSMRGWSPAVVRSSSRSSSCASSRMQQIVSAPLGNETLSLCPRGCEG